jgi:hypothetical protein
MKLEIGEFNAHVNAQRKLPIKKLESLAHCRCNDWKIIKQQGT